MSTKAAPMLGDLVSVKGKAAGPLPEAVAGPVAVSLTGPVRSLSVKVDDNRYKQLKIRGVQESKTTQDLLIQAIDLLLRSKP